MDKLLITAKTSRADRALSRLHTDTTKAHARLKRFGVKPAMVITPVKEAPAQIVIELQQLTTIRDAFKTYGVEIEDELDIKLV